MNQPPITIFSDNGVLKGAIMPDKNDPSFQISDHEDDFWIFNEEGFETARAKAWSERLPIENPEIATTRTFSNNQLCIRDGRGTGTPPVPYYNVAVEGKNYEWPGKYEVREKAAYPIDHTSYPPMEKVYHLSL